MSADREDLRLAAERCGLALRNLRDADEQLRIARALSRAEGPGFQSALDVVIGIAAKMHENIVDELDRRAAPLEQLLDDSRERKGG